MALEKFFEKYDRLVLFDTETTGLFSNRDEIIEFAAVVVEQRNGEVTVVEEYDQLITLSPGGSIPPKIVELTGITEEDLRDRGVSKDKVDLLTVYKDRHSYPHKLCHAIEAYGLAGKVVNSHQAVDDVLATVEVMKAMEEEKDDLLRYVNLFGYHPKYGIDGKPIGSVTYKPQGFDPIKPLYEM